MNPEMMRIRSCLDYTDPQGTRVASSSDYHFRITTEMIKIGTTNHLNRSINIHDWGFGVFHDADSIQSW
jgi:hypothetical protein